MRTSQEFLGRAAVARAARCALWLGFALMHHGERARASGWIARGHELLEGAHQDCVERGYLLLPLALQRVFAGDAAGGYRMFCQAAEIGDRFWRSRSDRARASQPRSGPDPDGRDR